MVLNFADYWQHSILKITIEDKMTSAEIRQSFIDFFKDKGHSFVPSSPVVPLDDPTLLFTNAGMNQFKDILLGTGSRPYTRAVNSQKCIRVSGKHNDLEEVGHDTYHHTFFEMLGNWSFGDYYKREAIQWAWELLTDVWKLPKDKLYATVFRDDDEAAELWPQLTDIDPEKVLRFDEKDNFWEMGDTGPCGPCSEIHIDLGPAHCDKQGREHTCFVNGDCGRYIELWNLVFIQFNRDDNGKLNPLPARHVDTGAGFERLVAVLQNKRSNYDTDLFQPIINHIADLAGESFETSSEKSAYNVIADHVRMLTFSIADGGLPSNDGRGYVMRRILRRAARYGRKLELREPFIYKLVSTVVDVLGDAFPEIRERAQHVATVIKSEEEHFNRTLDRGLDIFDRIKTDLHSKKKKTIPGKDVFKLYDTYGFPVDLTRILAEEEGLQIDEAGFTKEMQKQQDRARQSAKFHTTALAADQWQTVTEKGKPEFIGYTEDAVETQLLRYAVRDDRLHVVLARTPFYAESGGQVGDRGTMIIDGRTVTVLDTQKQGDDIIHICQLPDNFEVKQGNVTAQIDAVSRRQTEKNHTATHLLHAALRTVLGEHVQQAGSLVAPDRLRFDFTHFAKVDNDQLHHIEQLVNEKIQENESLQILEDSFDNAKKRGAMALFGEKYGDVVRTVQIADFSLELCGGTHVSQTGQIGPFVIVYEGSIASGVRRIEALTGQAAVEFLQRTRDSIFGLSEMLNVKDREILDKTRELLDEKKRLEKTLQKMKRDLMTSDVDSIINKGQTVNGINLVIHAAEEATVQQLKELGDKIREKAQNTVALLGTVSNGKVSFVCAVTDDLIKSKKLSAGYLVREVAKAAGGGGGGRPHLATAGGKDASRFDAAMQSIKKLIR